MSWLPRSNNHYALWEPLLNSIWVPEALKWPQMGLNIELNGKYQWSFWYMETPFEPYMVCFLNHIFSILYKRGLTCGDVYSLVCNSIQWVAFWYNKNLYALRLEWTRFPLFQCCTCKLKVCSSYFLFGTCIPCHVNIWHSVFGSIMPLMSQFSHCLKGIV